MGTQKNEQREKLLHNLYMEVQKNPQENKTPEDRIQEIKTYLRKEPKEIAGKMTLQTTARREYADDTVLHLKTLSAEEIHLQLQHYQLTTKSRKLKINWTKVEMLTKHKPYLKQNPLPEPFDNIKIQKKEKY